MSNFGDDTYFSRLFREFLYEPEKTKEKVLAQFEVYLQAKYPAMYDGEIKSRQQDPSEVFDRELVEIRSVKHLFTTGYKTITYLKRQSDECGEHEFIKILSDRTFKGFEAEKDTEFLIQKSTVQGETKINIGRFGFHFFAHTVELEVKIEPALKVELQILKGVDLNVKTMLQAKTFHLNKKPILWYDDGSPKQIQNDCHQQGYCCFSEYIFINIQRSVLDKEAIKNQSYVEIESILQFHGATYVLFGLLCHHGNSPRGGHWTATVTNDSGRYTTYNDDHDPITYATYDEYVVRSRHVDKTRNRDDRTCLLYMRTP